MTRQRELWEHNQRLEWELKDRNAKVAELRDERNDLANRVYELERRLDAVQGLNVQLLMLLGIESSRELRGSPDQLALLMNGVAA